MQMLLCVMRIYEVFEESHFILIVFLVLCRLSIISFSDIWWLFILQIYSNVLFFFISYSLSINSLIREIKLMVMLS